MNKPLPSLNALRAFVAVAKHGSLKDAASELFVTPSALSHQIRNMENLLNIQLFQRSKAGLTLSPSGNLIYADLADAFKQINQTMAKLNHDDHGELLNVSMLSTFAMRWFIPRLSSFQQLHPNIEVRISTSIAQIDFEREDMDCAIRSGHGQWQGLHTEYLFSETFTPVCTPKLAQALQTPNDLLNYPLLHALLRPDDWHVWLAAAGITAQHHQHGQTFETRNFAIQAAVDGVGIAMIDPSLVTKEVNAGQLVLPFSQTLADNNAYYLVYPEQYTSLDRIQAFQAWLLAQVKSF